MTDTARFFTGRELMANGEGEHESSAQVFGILAVGFVLLASIGVAFLWNPFGFPYEGQLAVVAVATILSMALIVRMLVRSIRHENARDAGRARLFSDRGIEVAPAEVESIFRSQDAARVYREGLIFTFNGVRDGRVALFSVHGEDNQLVVKDELGAVVKPL